jgi:hypothetical protein
VETQIPTEYHQKQNEHHAPFTAEVARSSDNELDQDVEELLKDIMRPLYLDDGEGVGQNKHDEETDSDDGMEN